MSKSDINPDFDWLELVSIKQALSFTEKENPSLDFSEITAKIDRRLKNISEETCNEEKNISLFRN